MPALDLKAQCTALVNQTNALADLTRGVDPSTPVPTCPEWSIANLMTHVGRGHRWAAAMIQGQATEELDWKSVPEGRLPKDPEQADEWLRRSARLIVEAVDGTGADTPIWCHVGPPQPARWWVRRRLHEATAHGADAALALGTGVSLPTELAADGISEFVEFLTLTLHGTTANVLPAGTTLILRATDHRLRAAYEWTLCQSADGIEYRRKPFDNSTLVSGTCSDLFLVLLRRIAVKDTRIDIIGDSGVFEDWLARTPY
ncbi:maleylpyruvate isomerase family mycothiol-dependent enzyme [Nocardia sp. BSTN01]|uniref:maleylpyruvate isomerase family mycothiol-dependent enzyme n=1 Tax=Nocardia sp. BSTN01 TaxID=2783665 RepID=UPI00188EEA5F|nr:maleylpyruvate isomerase family mycothiol-dependent enzyme [Nocardia sp. BSTN01]MBF4999718.1 maleylpyruvate isomerase family mycothiol-dependent enzyme [Nocardia sp. BSTN01]